MIDFSAAYTRIGTNSQGMFDEIPTNSYLREVHIDRGGVSVMDVYGNWGHIHYQDTTFTNNVALFNYLYPFTLINKPQTKKIEICKADLQTSNSVPIELIPTAGYGLINIPISMSYKFKYVGVAVPPQFDFVDDLYIHCSTKDDTNAMFQIVGSVLNGTADYSTVMPLITGSLQFEEDDSIVLKARTADATQGDGYLTIWITYVVVEESWYGGVYCV